MKNVFKLALMIVVIITAFMPMNIQASTISATSIADLQTKVSSATKDIKITLSSTFKTTLNNSIYLSAKHGHKVEIDGENKILVSSKAVNQRHFNIKTVNGSRIILKNVTLKGNLNSDNQNIPAVSSNPNGGVIVEESSIGEFDNVVFELISGGAIKVEKNGSLVINNSLFKSNSSFYGSGILAKNTTRAILINNSSFIKNIGNSNSSSSGAVILVNNLLHKLELKNSLFLDNFTPKSGSGGAIAIYRAQKSSVMNFNNCYFKNNKVDNGIKDGGSGGAIAAYNIKPGSQLNIQNSTFDNNRADGAGGALMIQSKTKDTAAKVKVRIANSTFYKNKSLGNSSLKTNVLSSGGGAIQFDLSNLQTSLLNNTFVGNSSQDISAKEQKRGGAVASNAGSINNDLILRGNIFLDNKLYDFNKKVRSSDYANVSLPIKKTTGNIGFDNGYKLPTNQINENVFGTNTPQLASNNTTVYAGSTTTKLLVPTIMISPMTADSKGLADDKGTNDKTLKKDARGFARATATPDQGSVEISWIKYNSNHGQWNLPQNNYNGNIYYEGVNPLDNYRIGYYGKRTKAISSEGLSRKGYTFKGWTEDKDSTKVTYPIGAELTFIKEITLYAVWAQNEGAFRITYNGNGSTGGSVPLDNRSYENNLAIILNADSLTKDGYTFIGWSTHKSASTSTYFEGDNLIVSSNVELYAVWQKIPVITYKVIYNGGNHTGGQTPIDSLEYNLNASVKVLGKANLVKTGYKFLGWNTKKDGSGQLLDSGKTLKINSNKVLYAVWKQGSVNKVSIIFDKNAMNAKDGTITQQVITKGSSLTSAEKGLGNPTRAGYTLTGWCTTREECIVTSKNVTKISGLQSTKDSEMVNDTIVYAQWHKLPDIPKTGLDISMIFIPFILGSIVVICLSRKKYPNVSKVAKK